MSNFILSTPSLILHYFKDHPINIHSFIHSLQKERYFPLPLTVVHTNVAPSLSLILLFILSVCILNDIMFQRLSWSVGFKNPDLYYCCHSKNYAPEIQSIQLDIKIQLPCLKKSHQHQWAMVDVRLRSSCDGGAIQYYFNFISSIRICQFLEIYIDFSKSDSHLYNGVFCFQLSEYPVMIQHFI